MASGGSGAQICVVDVDGWGCIMKELSVSTTTEIEKEKFEFEIELLLNLKIHRNIIVRIR